MPDLPKVLGFFLLAVSFLVSATEIEQSVVGRSVLHQAVSSIGYIVRLLGYVLLVVSELLVPLQPKPETKGLELGPTQPAVEKAHTRPKRWKLNLDPTAGFLMTSAIPLASIQAVLPVGALMVAAMYWRRATTGLERHLKPIAIAFALLGIFEILAVTHLYSGSSNIVIQQLTSFFGPLWMAEQIFLVLSIVVLGRWVWQYLIRRIQSQLFMIITSFTVIVFLVSTVSFTFLLFRNVSESSLGNLETAVNVLNYALRGKQAETLAAAKQVASSSNIISSVQNKSHDELNAALGSYLKNNSYTSLLVTTEVGQVLWRADDPDRWGDSISSDPLLKRTAFGFEGSSVTTRESVLAPVVEIRSASPIINNGIVVGAVIVGIAIDNAFVDGIKKDTGLDVSVYSGNTRSSTTFVDSDGKTRLIGVKEESAAIKKTVLEDSQTYKGSLSILNVPVLAVFTPLNDIDNTTVGMLFAGQTQLALLEAAGRSIELTFVLAIILLVVAIIPTYLISRYISYQIN